MFIKRFYLTEILFFNIYIYTHIKKDRKLIKWTIHIRRLVRDHTSKSLQSELKAIFDNASDFLTSVYSK